jgi:hypothetical protein
MLCESLAKIADSSSMVDKLRGIDAICDVVRKKDKDHHSKAHLTSFSGERAGIGRSCWDALYVARCMVSSPQRRFTSLLVSSCHQRIRLPQHVSVFKVANIWLQATISHVSCSVFILLSLPHGWQPPSPRPPVYSCGAPSDAHSPSITDSSKAKPF